MTPQLETAGECVICNKASPPYRCPQCRLQTCCLACYRQHLLLQQHMQRTRSQDPVLAHIEGEAAAAAATAAAATAAAAAESGACSAVATPTVGTSPAVHAASTAAAPAAAAPSPFDLTPASRVPLRVSFVGLRAFGEKEMEKDLQLLERAARAVEAAQRQRLESVESKKRKGTHPVQLRNLCQRRGVDFVFLPPTHSQRIFNRTKVLQQHKNRHQQQEQAQKPRDDASQEHQQQNHDRLEGVDECQVNQQQEKGRQSWVQQSEQQQPEQQQSEQQPQEQQQSEQQQPEQQQSEQQQPEQQPQEQQPQEQATDGVDALVQPAEQQHQQSGSGHIICWDACFRLPVGGGPCISLVLREDQKLRQHAALLQQHCCRKLQQGMQRKRGEASEATKDKELLRRCAMGPLLKAAAGNVGDPRAAVAPAAETGAARDMQPEATDATGETGFRLLLPVTAAHAGVILAPSPDTTTATNAKATEAEEGGQTTAGGSTGSQSDALLQAYLLPWDETLAECLKGTTIIEHPDLIVALPEELSRYTCWPPPCKGGPLSRLFSGTAQPPPPPPGPPPQHLCPPQQPEQQLLADGELEGSIRCMNGPCVSDHQQQQVQKRPPQVHQNHRPRPPQGCMAVPAAGIPKSATGWAAAPATSPPPARDPATVSAATAFAYGRSDLHEETAARKSRGPHEAPRLSARLLRRSHTPAQTICNQS
ncbi:uncharacterized protein LOC34617329 [Cyclospora cayetanensis]|uniref:Uncharacterized protein LOC34617329 n=1 Tax=Cyclospora cayetanensis TaxID=88456 RepID=A0A6P6RRV2_9EIME|nr:uncharacterized protein LOC34617329 [Cyclospora cayetanensis]